MTFFDDLSASVLQAGSKFWIFGFFKFGYLTFEMEYFN